MFSFLNPLFLMAAGAAVIPLLLHLLQKRRTVKIHFSTLRFLKIAQKRSASRVRLENFLLWLLRTLILLALALAFALPVLRTSSFGGFLGQAHRDIAIVWDGSYSMGYETGRLKVWDEARDTVTAIVRGLQSGDRVCLFLAEETVTPLIAQPTGDLELALSLIKAQSPRTGSSQLRAAVVAALEALQNSGNRERELYIITDGQALPWTDFAGQTDRLTTPPTFVTLLGPESPQNIAPQSVEIRPPVLLSNTTAKISVALSRTGDTLDTTVTLFVNEQEISRRTAGTQTEFILPPLPPGVHTARLETPADGLALDNDFHFLLRVKDRLPVLVVGSATDTFFLLRALNPGISVMEVTRVEPDALGNETLADYACIFLCNALPLPGQALLDLENYARRGGSLIFFPGDRATVADYESWSCLPAKPTLIEDITNPGRRPLRLLKPRDPLFTGLQLPAGAVPTITARRALAWQLAGGDANAEPLLGLSDTAHLLVSRPFGAGRTLLFAVSADRRWSDFPLSPIFLPLLHQIVQFSAGVSGEKPFMWAAKDLVLPAATEGTLLSPQNQPLRIRAAKQEAGTIYSLEDATQPGIYRRELDLVPEVAINIPRAESNLSPVPPGELLQHLGEKTTLSRDRAELLRQIEQHRIGRPLAETLLWLALALGLLEVFLANRAARPAPRAPAAHASVR